MWWKRKELERLYAELAVLAISDRLYSDLPDLTQNGLDLHAIRRRRLSELRAEIARLDPTTNDNGDTG